MPRGRATFNKRQKEQQRQQRQRDKAERKSLRKESRGQEGAINEMEELRRNAEEQAASFQVGADDHERA